MHKFVVTPGVADLVNCGYNNIGMADVGPAGARGFIWSWAEAEPKRTPGACQAAAMTYVRGSWTAQPCNTTYPALCRRGEATLPAGASPALWNITSRAVQFSQAPTECSRLGDGWAFDLPRDGRENTLVAQSALFSGLWGARSAGIWLNFAL